MISPTELIYRHFQRASQSPGTHLGTLQRRESHQLQWQASSAPSRKTARLANTFFLPIPADEAQPALHELGLERFALDIVTIPVEGGCVVAVFASQAPHAALLSRFRQAREQHSVESLLTSIGATAIPSHA